MVSYAWWGCIKNCSKTVKLWNIITIWNYCFLLEYIVKCNLFLWCKAEFSASLLQYSVSHDPSEISLICWIAERFLIIIHVENSYAAIYFCGNHDNTSSRLFIEIEMSLMSLLIYLMQPCWIKEIIIYIYIYIHTHSVHTYMHIHIYIYKSQNWIRVCFPFPFECCEMNWLRWALCENQRAEQSDVGNGFNPQTECCESSSYCLTGSGHHGGWWFYRVINHLCRTGNSMIFNQLTCGNQNIFLNANLRINNCETMRKKQER